MEMVQVQLPVKLVRRVEQTIPPGQALEQVLAEAIETWLDSQQPAQAAAEAAQALLFLREAGLVMSAERQQAFAQAIRATLEPTENPIREEVEAALIHLTPPLSAEIIALRGEG
jgi:hypothetical protein